MSKLDRSIGEIVLELNEQLKESMPVGRFVALTLVCLDESRRTGEIWVGGTPEAFLLDAQGEVAGRFASENLPLGVVDSSELDARPKSFSWMPNSQLLLYSDGLLEASSPTGEQFGIEGLLASAAGTPPHERFGHIEAALAQHQCGGAASDDVSLLLIDCP